MTGTITLTKMNIVPSSSSSSSHRPVHVFIETHGTFDSSQCFNANKFTIDDSSRGCIIITNMTARTAVLDPNDKHAQLQLNTSPDGSLRLCYLIRGNQPGLGLKLLEMTPLNLLLNSGFIKVTPFCATPDVWFKLFSSRLGLPQNKRCRDSLSDKAADAAAKKRCI